MTTERPPPIDERGREISRRAKQRVGTVVDGKWTLESLLGVGGMAAVYAGTHRNGKRGAVKILHAHEAMDPGVKSRFLREGYVANKVDHPGSVSILDDDEAPDGTTYLVMELLEGESLETHCPPGTTMAAGDVMVMMDKLLDVLAAAHAKGIIHRDIKPSNLFLTQNGQLKVLDFGIARLHEIEHAKAQRTTDAALGTPGFMPPEQARGRWAEVDARSDVWAVGATMYTLLTGRWLHDEGTLNEQLVAAMTKPCPKMSEAAPSVPAALGSIIDRAIAFDKQDRWPQARDMQDAIRTAYETVVGRAMSLAPHVRTSGRTSIVDNSEMASLPTVAAPTSDEFARKSGGGPVSVSASTSPTTASQKRKRVGGAAAGVVGLVTIVVVGSVVLRNREGPKAGTVSSTTALASTVQVATAKDTTSMEPAIATTETHVATAATAKTAGLPAVRAKIDAGPAASAAPSASATEAVDIFGRRK